ncbi:MAG: hypothetical protein II843_01920 [Alphaproteobacteria bacterium]|nr:hypothetical protein [Alphaproteobacteria bacterium]MBQ6011807.1 hypothetical protein [Alphaproteobacteria bacterium]
MKVKYKLIFIVPAMALTMGACKTYINTVTNVFDGKKILMENAEGEERMIDCSKKTAQTEQLLKDIPYFRKGDQIKLKQAKVFGNNYDGRRVFTTEDYKVVYPLDTIQIRKDQEIIAKEKATHVR